MSLSDFLRVRCKLSATDAAVVIAVALAALSALIEFAQWLASAPS